MTVSAELAPRGSTWIRQAISLAVTKNIAGDAADYAAARWGAASKSAQAMKAAITQSDIATAQARSAQAEMMALVRDRSLVGRVRFRRVVPHVRTLTTANGASVAWVEPGAARPLSIPEFEPGFVAPKSVAGMVLATMEALREGGAAFEDLLREELVTALSLAIDGALLDTGTANPLAPPSLLSDAPEVDATDDAGDDLRDLIAAFEGDLSRAVFAMHPKTAASLSGPDRSNIGLAGGELLGASVYTTRAAPAGIIALIDPARVFVCEGTIDVQTAFEGTVATETASVPLFQTNSAAIRAELGIGWKAEEGAAAFVTGATYGGEASS